MYFFEYGKGREGYWKGDKMVLHTEELMDALEFKYPEFQFVFVCDWSSGHANIPRTILMSVP